MIRKGKRAKVIDGMKSAHPVKKADVSIPEFMPVNNHKMIKKAHTKSECHVVPAKAVPQRCVEHKINLEEKRYTSGEKDLTLDGVFQNIPEYNREK